MGAGRSVGDYGGGGRGLEECLAGSVDRCGSVGGSEVGWYQGHGSGLGSVVVGGGVIVVVAVIIVVGVGVCIGRVV